MSQGIPKGPGLDARHYLALPRWIKSLLFGIAGTSFVVSIALVVRWMASPRAGENILFYLSVAQTAALVLVFMLVVVYATQDGTARQLTDLGNEFVRKYIRDALAKVSVPAKGIAGYRVMDEGSSDIFGRSLAMHAEGRDDCAPFRLWIGLNINRLFVIYFVPCAGNGRSAAELATELKNVFRYTFGGAEKVGYAINFEAVEPADGHEGFVSIWMTVTAEGDFLYSPREKLFWAQDIAMMTESFLRTAARNNIDLSLEGRSLPKPGPL